MLRLTQIKLPLDHSPNAISKAAISRLGIRPNSLISCTIFRRAHDARKKKSIFLIYTLDVEVKNEASILERLTDNVDVKPRPDIDYKFVDRKRGN